METGFLHRTYRDSQGRDFGYSLFVPRMYDSSRSWPLVLFLHGAGETGNDGHRQITVGLGPHIAKRIATFPFLALFPQSHRGSWRAGSPDAGTALEILDELRARFNVDPARIHLTGISMGGYGTWSLAAAHPDLWAAIVPVCGGGDPATAPRIAGIPCWCFHGDADEIIPVEASREMIQALRAAGARPRYTEFENVGHNSWDPAYSTPELYDWWINQRRAARAA